MVESAIVLPLTVFMILGLLQLGLLQQGRSMAKYGAYKAARAGAIHNAKMDVMEKAALAVLLPVTGYPSGGGGEAYNRTRDSGDLKSAWQRMRTNRHSDGNSLKVVDVRICTPTTELLGGSSSSVDFDDPKLMNPAQSDLGDGAPPPPGAEDPSPGGSPTNSWKFLDKGKLSVQVTFNYRLVIPFANMVIWNLVRADQVSDQLLQVTRLGSTKNGPIKGIRKTNSTKTDTDDSKIDSLGKNGKYFLPIRASFAMRMQSNLFPGKNGFEIPSRNDCVINFKKQ